MNLTELRKEIENLKDGHNLTNEEIYKLMGIEQTVEAVCNLKNNDRTLGIFYYTSSKDFQEWLKIKELLKIK